MNLWAQPCAQPVSYTHLTVFFFMKQYLDASLPMEIVEAARIDGAGEFYTFNKIVLPLSLIHI